MVSHFTNWLISHFFCPGQRASQGRSLQKALKWQGEGAAGQETRLNEWTGWMHLRVCCCDAFGYKFGLFQIFFRPLEQASSTWSYAGVDTAGWPSHQIHHEGLCHAKMLPKVIWRLDASSQSQWKAKVPGEIRIDFGLNGEEGSCDGVEMAR